MRKTLLTKLALLLVMLVGAGSASAATTYKLTQVTSVEAGGLYVFEQDGYVMNNTVSSSALQTTNSYKTTGLAGTESYVWTLETATGGFYMKNVSLSTYQYLNNTSSTNVSFGSKNSIWVFAFTNGVAEIQNKSNNNRFLGYTNSTSHAYKAYATSNSDSYSHAITVYKLGEEVVDENQVKTPSITGDDGSFFTTKTVTISTETSGASIYYTLDGTDPTDESTLYSAPFDITETTTVKAIAVKNGMTNSTIASETFTKIETKANIAALVADLKSGETAYVQIHDAMVTYKNGTTAYLEDASGAVMLYECASDLEAGDKITGIMNVTSYQVYNNLPEVKGFSLESGYTKTSGNTVTPTEVTLATLLSNYESYLSRYVIIKGAIVKSAFDGKNSTIQQGDNEIILRDQNSTATLTSTEGQAVTVTANVAIYGTTKQLAVYEQSQIEEFNGEKLAPTIVVNDNETVAYGTTFTVDDTMIEGGDITVTSNNTNVAIVDGFVITPVAVGTTTITVATAENNLYKAGSETFTLNVTAPAGEATAKPSGNVVLFHETFGDNSGSARDWKDSYSAKSGVSEVYTGITGYTVANAKQGKNTTGSNGSGLNQSTADTDASIIIGPLNVADYSNMTLTYQWKAASTKGTYTTNAYYATSANGTYSEITGTGDGATTFVERTYSLPAAAQVSTLYLKIVWNTSNTQAIIDEVELTSPVAATETVALNASGFATFCSKYPMDFSTATDYSAWQITNIDNENKITFEQITGSVKGGTGIFLKGEAGKTVTLTSADSENELSGNLLEGILAPTYVAAGKYYGLSGENFVKIKEGTVKAGKAILDADWITTTSPSPSRFTFVFGNQTTGISEVEHGAFDVDDTVYSLSGQRVNTPKKGLYIVNGKKVMMK